jgi:hypothetical protein
MWSQANNCLLQPNRNKYHLNGRAMVYGYDRSNISFTLIGCAYTLSCYTEGKLLADKLKEAKVTKKLREAFGK